ncbi:DoxX family protein [Nocardia sp. NPDC056611]|uniref:DoxX family protein n=1 Tax=Nocardia sp. NPDC056611 TaxID=3345877 RepID=UPI003671BF4F
MNTLLWTLQIALALAFAGSGATKLVQPRDILADHLGTWVERFPGPLVGLLGLAELLAAIALTVPPALGVAAGLAPVAAAGLVAMMMGAAVVRARENQYLEVATTALLAIAALTVAWGRFGLCL